MTIHIITSIKGRQVINILAKDRLVVGIRGKRGNKTRPSSLRMRWLQSHLLLSTEEFKLISTNNISKNREINFCQEGYI